MSTRVGSNFGISCGGSEESGTGGAGGGSAAIGVGEEGIMIETCGAAAICIGSIATVGTIGGGKATPMATPIGEGPGQQNIIPCGEAKPDPCGTGKAYPRLFILEGG